MNSIQFNCNCIKKKHIWLYLFFFLKPQGLLESACIASKVVPSKFGRCDCPWVVLDVRLHPSGLPDLFTVPLCLCQIRGVEIGLLGATREELILSQYMLRNQCSLWNGSFLYRQAGKCVARVCVCVCVRFVCVFCFICPNSGKSKIGRKWTNRCCFGPV